MRRWWTQGVIAGGFAAVGLASLLFGAPALADGGAGAAVASGNARLFETADDRSAPKGEAAEALARVKAERTAVGAVAARLIAEPGRSELLRHGVKPAGGTGEPVVEIPLGGDAVLRTKPGELKPLDGGDQRWTADTLAGDGQVTLIIGAKGVTGTIDAGSKLYTVVPLADGWNAIVERRPRLPMKDHPE